MAAVAVARPGCRQVPGGEAALRRVPALPPVVFLEAGVGVANPAPALLLFPAGAGRSGLACCHSRCLAFPRPRWPVSGAGRGRSRAS